jgi:hypothetical protein
MRGVYFYPQKKYDFRSALDEPYPGNMAAVRLRDGYPVLPFNTVAETMIVEIASIRFKIGFDKSQFNVSPYFSDLVNRCRANSSDVDFSIVFKNTGPGPLMQCPGPILNGMSFQEITGCHFLFKVHNVFCSVLSDKKVAEIFRTDNKAILDMTVIALLKLLTSVLVLDKGGVPLHCSAVSCREKGYIFCGKSGTGKSTIAFRLKSKYTILGDEFNVALPCKDLGYRVYSSPFTKQENIGFFTLGSAPASKIFLLPGGKNRRPAEGGRNKKLLTQILEHVFVFPTSDWYAGKLFENTAALVAAVPIEVIEDRDSLVSRLLEE